MTNRQRRTLAAIFETPTKRDIRFDSIEALMSSLGAVRKERAGSRVAFVMEGAVILLHRPHNPKTMRPGAVKDLRDFLAGRNISPDSI